MNTQKQFTAAITAIEKALHREAPIVSEYFTILTPLINTTYTNDNAEITASIPFTDLTEALQYLAQISLRLLPKHTTFTSICWTQEQHLRFTAKINISHINQ